MFQAFAISTALPLSGCAGGFPFAQSLEIEQGNRLERADIDRISPGMSTAQVRSILGEPLLEHPFAPERWDYLYEHSGTPDRADEVPRQRFTLFFEQGRVAAIEDKWSQE
ncbi:outer membrane protein assembly factor BamE [Halorhodospira abdelmalekii]|uniref:outer membrane protein assembly factor BamE n=1 Tax=Halorhodospira abdelmalekii TaxID=421629 RepID=UPI001907DAEE|nr:outer membrane protein assembly factor BamE [Halorhodospira abdelmalekii]